MATVTRDPRIEFRLGFHKAVAGIADVPGRVDVHYTPRRIGKTQLADQCHARNECHLLAPSYPEYISHAVGVPRESVPLVIDEVTLTLPKYVTHRLAGLPLNMYSLKHIMSELQASYAGVVAIGTPLPDGELCQDLFYEDMLCQIHDWCNKAE
jgi:hypothetical protein